MKISLVTHGTRGDVQPMLAVGDELRRRGHDVVLGVPPNLTDVGTAAGFPSTAVGPDSQALLSSDEGRAWLAAGDVRAFTREVSRLSHAHIRRTLEGLEAAAAGADLIVSGVMVEDVAAPLAEARGTGFAVLHSTPLRRTRTHANPLVTTRRLPGTLNLATGALFDQVWWRGFRADVDAYRRELGLEGRSRPVAAALADADVLEVQAYSPVLVPGLADYGPRRPLTGLPAPSAELRDALGDPGADADLEAWLDAGDPPAYLGFGSMPVTDPAATLALLSEVTGRLGLRALVNAGWAGLAGGAADHVRVVSGMDHPRILPRCTVAVHHGGAGTTEAVARAGIPAVVCSVFADQPFWGAQVERLGLGVHLRFAALDAGTLEQGLRTALRPEVARRAREVGEALRAQPDPTAAVADLLEAEEGRTPRW